MACLLVLLSQQFLQQVMAKNKEAKELKDKTDEASVAKLKELQAYMQSVQAEYKTKSQQYKPVRILARLRYPH